MPPAPVRAARPAGFQFWPGAGRPSPGHANANVKVKVKAKASYLISATSLADIAVTAGVASPTAFAALGAKPAQLRRVLDQVLPATTNPSPSRNAPGSGPSGTPRHQRPCWTPMPGMRPALISSRAARGSS